MQLELLNPPLILKHIASKYKRRYSPIIEICGPMRIGKTTKAYVFAQWLSWLLFKRPWDWRNNTVVSVDQLVRKLNVSNDGEIMVMDEVQRQLSRKRWHDPNSQLFNLLMESQARKHFIIFLILPHAWELGSDHAANVNFVIPFHSRTMCQPYALMSSDWDISQKHKDPMKFPLGHFDIDIKDKWIAEAFKDELKELPDYNAFIDTNLKDVILDEACEKCGIYNPRKPISDSNMPDWLRSML